MGENRIHKGDVIRYVMESCGLTNPDEIVMIGDRENDMIGATAEPHGIGWCPLRLRKPR